MSLVPALFAALTLSAQQPPPPAAGPAARPSRPAADTVPSDSVIAHYYAAIGGRDKLTAIKSRKMVGTYEQGSLKAQVTILASRPGVRTVRITAPGIDHAEGYDGTTWRHEFTTGETVREKGLTDEIGRRGAEFDESFVQYAARHNRVTSLGRGMLDGKPTYGLHVITADGEVKDYFFDGKTSLIVAVRRRMKLPNGKIAETLTTYDDWKPVSGVLMPHLFTERSTANGRVLNRTTWSSITVNVPTTLADFHPPVRRTTAHPGTPTR